MLLVGLLIFVVLPAVASPLLTQMLRERGLRGDDLNVSVAYFDPALLTGRAAEITIRGRNVELPPALVGDLELTFGDVSFVERSFESIRGTLADVSLAAAGLTVKVSTVDVEGPSDAAVASGEFNATETQQLVEHAARRAGLPIDSVNLVDGGLRLRLGSLETTARVAVAGGALVLQPEIGQPVVLLQPEPSDPWRLTEAFVSPGGVTVIGTLDAATLAGLLWGDGTP